jgi:hypothetical protein
MDRAVAYGQTIAEYVTAWLAARENEIATNTHVRYRQLAKNQVLPYVGGLGLEELTPDRLQVLYRELAISGGAKGSPLQSSTIGQVHRFLHVCFEKATTDGLLSDNPVDRVRSPRVGKVLSS